MKKYILLVFLSIISISSNAIEIIVGSSVGSQSDTVARMVAPTLEKEFTDTVKVNNVVGNSGALAIKNIIETDSSEQKILVAYSNMVLLRHIQPELDLDAMGQLEPVYGAGYAAMALFTGYTSNIKSIKDLIDLYKIKGKITVGTTSSVDMLLVVQLSKLLNIKITEIKYKQQSDLYRDLVNGVIDLNIGGFGKASIQSYIDDNKIIPIIILGNIKSSAYPDLNNLKDIETFSWTGFFVKKNAPEEFKNKVKKALLLAMDSKEAVKYETGNGKPKLWRADAATMKAQLMREDAIIPQLINVLK